MINKLKLDQLNRLSKEKYLKHDKYPVRIILDSVRSALNVGSCFRTADGCGIEGLDLCGITAHPPHKNINKTALGADEVVHWESFDDIMSCIRLRKSQGYTIVAVEQTSESIQLQDWKLEGINEKIVLIFGNEVKGVSLKVLQDVDYVLEIPQFGTKHSFNISVSVGMVLWQYLSYRV